MQKSGILQKRFGTHLNIWRYNISEKKTYKVNEDWVSERTLDKEERKRL